MHCTHEKPLASFLLRGAPYLLIHNNMKNVLLQSLLVTLLTAAHSLLPALGLLNTVLLWAATHSAQLQGATLLGGLLLVVIRLCLILPRLWRRWFG
jgi:hypothetical protein